MGREGIYALIPKDKFDTSTIDELMKISEDEVKIILPELLCWIADFNWPIAKDMINVLKRFSNNLIPLIQNALSADESDDMLKYWIIRELMPVLSKEAQKQLLTDIKRICDFPTMTEEIEGVCEEAKEFIENQSI